MTAAEAAARAARIALVLCDNDGVLTDGQVYVSARGEELKAYSLRDGMGVERLRAAGVATAIVTRERSEFARRRADKLRLPHCWLGIADKRAMLGRILEEAGVRVDQVAYIGDDVNDLGIIQAIAPVGLCAAPADAMPEVVDAVHLVTRRPGGRGAFRELAEWILRQRPAQPPGGAS
ncbi:MAG: 3-deoxy-D-manno-octulosonate 8-phosphate phosphatase [Myxococcales bacterium]|nr:3-deoxy-D-manno-octulosonate 8-phosphate phosphatase [Myxococcales bacterium]